MTEALSLIALGATLTAYERFTTNSNRTTDQNDAQDRARNALDLITKQLRNHAAPAPDQQLGIDKFDPYDLVFQTVDTPKPAGSANSRNVRRVRYCLDSSVPGNEKIWFQYQTWTTAATPGVPSTASCPDPAWPNREVLLDHIVNRIGGVDRPVWMANDPRLNKIASIRTRVFVDIDTRQLPKEQPLDTTVYLRNENQTPNATFTYLVNANGSVVLNATGSSDPEGDRISFQWYDGTTNIGQDLAWTWQDPTSGSHDVTLEVTDASGLTESVTQTIDVP
jgi:hypothetical protein